MVKSPRIPASLVAIVLLLSIGGCVLKSTHQKALDGLATSERKLQRTETELAATQAAKTDLEGRYAQSQADNARLKSGLEGLAGGLDVAAAKVQTVGTSVEQLRAAGGDVSSRLAELQRVVMAQAVTITTLGQAIGPLRDEVEALRAKVSALARRTATTGPVSPGR